MRVFVIAGLLVSSLVTRSLAALNSTNSTTTSTSSNSDAVSSSTNIGDYIAAGFGLASTTTTSKASSDSTTLSLEKTSTEPLNSSSKDVSFSKESHRQDAAITGGNTVTKASTSYFSSCKPTTTNSRGQVYADCSYGSKNVTNTFTNTTWASATDVDECWTQWVSYWSMHTPSPATVSVISYSVPETTETTPYLYTEGSYITDKTITTVITSTASTAADNGGFTHDTQLVVTYTTVLTAFLSASTTSTSMYTYTHTPWKQNYTLISASNDADWPAPSCTLPSVYPACQSQWDKYATHNIAPNPQPLSANCEFNFLNTSQTVPACYASNEASWGSWRSYVSEATSPICSQASITGSVCTSLKDAYVLGHNYNLAPDLPEPATFSSGHYSNVAPWFTGWTWPATQAFAPGCTLDCGRCAVTGGTIELLYFPPGLTPHAATEPVVATTLGTVLTSPTYYISFASLYASDACSGVGSTLTSMIVPIPTSEPLSTLFATTMACDAHRMNNAWLGLVALGTASLNVTDLMHDSVPYSIYTSQPYCASKMMEAVCDPDACPTTLPYRPLIVLSSELLNTLNPAWATCSLDLRGLYDPPKALQQATGLVVPTALGGGASPTTSATPASGPAKVTPSPTPQPEHGESKPSQNPADLPVPASPTAKPNTSPPVKPPSASANDPAPIENEPSEQSGSVDPVGVIISAIVGLSDNKASTQTSAAEPATFGPEASAPQDPPKSPTDALGALNGSPADPANSGGAPAPFPGQGGNGDSSHPQAPDSNTVPPGSQSGSDDPLKPADPGSDSNTNSGSGDPTVNDDPVVFSVGSQVITAAPGQPLIVAGSTLSSKAALTVDGHIYSSGSAGLIVDGTAAVLLPSSGSQASVAVVTLGSQALTASAADDAHSAGLVIDGTTLTPGGSVATIDGTVVSAGSAGLVVDGTQTIPLSNHKPDSTALASQAALTLGSSTITAAFPVETGNVVVVDGTTLSEGGSAVTIDGTEISVGTAGIVVGGTSTISPTDPATNPSQTQGGSDESATGSSAVADPDNTSSTTQSSGRRTFDARLEWMFAVMAVCMVLGGVLV